LSLVYLVCIVDVRCWQILLQKWSEEEAAVGSELSLACHSPVRAVAGDYSNHSQRNFGVT
jgi:hypothetical protein